jgi:hypothetical protein
MPVGMKLVTFLKIPAGTSSSACGEALLQFCGDFEQVGNMLVSLVAELSSGCYPRSKVQNGVCVCVCRCFVGCRRPYSCRFQSALETSPTVPLELLFATHRRKFGCVRVTCAGAFRDYRQLGVAKNQRNKNFKNYDSKRV